MVGCPGREADRGYLLLNRSRLYRQAKLSLAMSGAR